MLTPEQIADGWIAHDGGECPVDGPISFMLADGFIGSAVDPSALYWEWAEGRKGFQCIIAYRPEPSHD